MYYTDKVLQMPSLVFLKKFYTKSTCKCTIPRWSYKYLLCSGILPQTSQIYYTKMVLQMSSVFRDHTTNVTCVQESFNTSSSTSTLVSIIFSLSISPVALMSPLISLCSVYPVHHPADIKISICIFLNLLSRKNRNFSASFSSILQVPSGFLKAYLNVCSFFASQILTCKWVFWK